MANSNRISIILQREPPPTPGDIPLGTSSKNMLKTTTAIFNDESNNNNNNSNTNSNTNSNNNNSIKHNKVYNNYRYSRGYIKPISNNNRTEQEADTNGGVPRGTDYPHLDENEHYKYDNIKAIMHGKPKAESETADKYEEHRPLFVSDEIPAPSNKIALFPIWHPKREPYRWAVLLVACFFSVGSYFAYDSIGVIQTELEQFFGISGAKFGLLYSVYTFPNIILPFFGGFFLDYVGLPIGTSITCSLVTIGAFMVALAPSYNSFYMMLAGRFIFGIGAETSYVAQNTICCAWFKDGKQLALAMGLTVSAGRLGSYFTFTANARAVEYFGNFTAALWLGAFMASLSFVAGILYMILHYSALRIIKGTSLTLDIPQSQPDIKFSQAFHFHPVFYLACVVCCAYYSAIFPFQSTATNLLEETHDYSTLKAANYISLLPLTSFFMSPVFGFIVDRVGKRVYFSMVGLFIMMPSFALLMVPWWPPVASMIAIGLIFSLVPAALWPCIPLLVEEKYIGTSFGLLSGGLNACLTLFYWLQGNLPDTDGRFGEVMLFTGLAAVGFVFSIVWVIVDKRMGSICNGKNPPVATKLDSDH